MDEQDAACRCQQVWFRILLAKRRRLLFPSRHRYHPRTQQDRDRTRRDAAVRALIADLATRLSAFEKEQQVQFKRIADLQAQLDELVRLVKKNLPQ
jgi:hypothetical protein